MKLDLELKIEGHDVSVGEEARAWIDVDRNDQMNDNDEVDLLKNDLVWTGSIETEQPTKFMSFLIKYIASPGTAKWSLKITSGTDELFSGEGDVLHLQNRIISFLRK